ncbi:unnamed protein product [Discosporangium mesarthrocarpum]
MADYWRHWIDFGAKLGNAAPPIFRVNWFRKDEDGNFIWPGFGENMRVIEWIVGRVNKNADAVESPLGLMPRYQDLNWSGLDFDESSFNSIMTVDRTAGQNEAEAQKELFDSFGDKLPPEMEAQRQALLATFAEAPEVWRAAE